MSEVVVSQIEHKKGKNSWEHFKRERAVKGENYDLMVKRGAKVVFQAELTKGRFERLVKWLVTIAEEGDVECLTH